MANSVRVKFMKNSYKTDIVDSIKLRLISLGKKVFDNGKRIYYLDFSNRKRIISRIANIQ